MIISKLGFDKSVKVSKPTMPPRKGKVTKSKLVMMRDKVKDDGKQTPKRKTTQRKTLET